MEPRNRRKPCRVQRGTRNSAVFHKSWFLGFLEFHWLEKANARSVDAALLARHGLKSLRMGRFSRIHIKFDDNVS